MSAASLLIFRTLDRRHIIRSHLGALSGIKSSTQNGLPDRVIIATPNHKIVEKPVQHRIPHSYPPLTVPGFELDGLQLPYIYIFSLDLLPFQGQHKFMTYSSAIQFLSPVVTAGLWT